MCLILYKKCKLCPSNERHAVRCVNALLDLSSGPCSKTYDNENKIDDLSVPIYGDKYVCPSCAVVIVSKEEIYKYLLHYSYVEFHLTTLMIQLIPGYAHICKI